MVITQNVCGGSPGYSLIEPQWAQSIVFIVCFLLYIFFTDGLCEDGRCKDDTTMNRLLRFREEEMENVNSYKKMVEGLVIICLQLQEHLKGELNYIW